MYKGTAATLSLLVFAIALAADLVFTVLDIASLRIISKPLIVLALLAYFLFSTRAVVSPLKAWVVGALVFSWLGDVLLLFESRSSLYFILGLSSFLLAQVAYTVFFQKLRRAGAIGFNALYMAIALVYCAILITFLFPHLGPMKLPVLVYGLVISLMLAVAMHLGRLPQKKAAVSIVLGAIFFVLSDSLLAINKFYTSFAGAGLLVMITYGMAQFFIVRGSILAFQKEGATEPLTGRKEELYNDSFTD